jgi:hypothetical protein
MSAQATNRENIELELVELDFLTEDFLEEERNEVAP